MADIICVIGDKGGTGKTTLTHMLGHGLSLLEHKPICVFSSDHGQTLETPGRKYQCHGSLGHADLKSSLAQMRGNVAGPVIVDSTGRDGLDLELYELADLVLLPFRDSCEDIRLVLRNLAAFPQAYAVPSQWPTNAWQKRVASRLVDESLGHYRDQTLRPVYALSITKVLLNHRLPDVVPVSLNDACRDLAHQIAQILGMAFRAKSANDLLPVSRTRRKKAA